MRRLRAYMMILHGRMLMEEGRALRSLANSLQRAVDDVKRAKAGVRPPWRALLVDLLLVAIAFTLSSLYHHALWPKAIGAVSILRLAWRMNLFSMHMEHSADRGARLLYWITESIYFVGAIVCLFFLIRIHAPAFPCLYAALVATVLWSAFIALCELSGRGGHDDDAGSGTQA